MKRLLFFIVFMSVATGLLLQVAVRTPDEREPASEEPTAPANLLQLEEATLTEFAGDRVRWELRAAAAQYHEASRSGRLQQVRFRVFPQERVDGGVLLSGRSGRAEFATERQGLVLEGDVRLRKGDELEIRTERLEYDEATAVITAPTAVWVRSAAGIQRGGSLRYSIPDGRLEFTSPVFVQ